MNELMEDREASSKPTVQLVRNSYMSRAHEHELTASDYITGPTRNHKMCSHSMLKNFSFPVPHHEYLDQEECSQ